MSLPNLLPVEELSPIFKSSENYVRARLRERDWPGVKIAGRWYMTEEQVQQTIEKLSTTVRQPPPPSPAGLVQNSRFRRRVHARSGLSQ